MSSNIGDLNKSLVKKVEEDIKDKDGKVIAEKGTKLIRAAQCPKCGRQYRGAIRVTACNICGYRLPREITPTDNEINRHTRRQRQQLKVQKKVK